MAATHSELICPKCTVSLQQIRTPKGIFWGCDRCGGRAITVELLRRIFTAESINPLWKHAISGEGITSRSCPQCRQAMLEVNLAAAASELDRHLVRVDVC
ncbi:MAG TPA: zf-TFIIB domain-containing protein, partial [Chthoniobacterales bacterium]|nr:zf-TFIIB domain-containing protein [Chthoniobacterales bacterium]